MTTLSDRTLTALERLELELTPTGDVVPPCPDWCGKEAGHDYDSSDYDLDRFNDFGQAVAAGVIRACRYHRAVIRDVEREHISVSAFEMAEVQRGQDPVLIIEPATVYTIMAFDDEMDAQDARKLAADLIAAAALVERING
jgi:hypothetical protein